MLLKQCVLGIKGGVGGNKKEYSPLPSLAFLPLSPFAYSDIKQNNTMQLPAQILHLN